MSASKSIMNSSNLNFQNNYMRYRVGAPVVPVVKSIQTIKRHGFEQANHNNANSNEQNYSLNRNIENDYTDINESMNSAITSVRISTPPAYSANNVYGEEMLLPVHGYFCSVCDLFFETRDKAYQEHCTTKTHYENYIKLCSETLKSQRSVEQNVTSLDLTNDLVNNPLPIKIKIENTDTFPNNDNVKRPLSERLGAIKKPNKSKLSKKLKNQFQIFDGDYNKSVLQFLPKPSSHITPSRKVFVEDYNLQHKFGQNTLYSSPMYNNL